MDDHNFRLGPAMLKLEGAPSAPDTWRAAVLGALDGQSATRLAQTCPAALDCLLSEWPRATLTVPLHDLSVELPESLVRRLQRARQQLTRRGFQATTLQFVQRGHMSADATDQPLQTALTALGCGYTLSRHFTLSLQFQHLSSKLLRYAAQAFMGLRSLSVSSLHVSSGCLELPPPATLPALQRLTISKVPFESQDSLKDSMQVYLPQLTDLTMPEQDDVLRSSEFVSIFTPKVISYTLKRLDIYTDLTPTLTACLQRSAPALETLTIRRWCETGGAEAVSPVCSWRTLILREGTPGLLSVARRVAEWLPLPAQGKLVLDLSDGSHLDVILPLTEPVVHKLHSIELRGCSKIKVSRGTGHDADIDLRAALPVLKPLQAPHMELVLDNFTMTAALAEELHTLAGLGWRKVSLDELNWPEAGFTQPLPPLHRLGLLTNVDDSLLAQLQRALSSVDQLCFPSVSNVSGPLAQGSRMPWRVLHVESADLLPWVAVAESLGDSVSWAIRRLYIEVGPVQAQWPADLVKRVSRIRLVELQKLQLHSAYDDYESWEVPSLDTASLRLALDIVKALPCHADTLSLYRLRATPDFVAALAHLPHWPGTLSLGLTSGNVKTWDKKAVATMGRAPWLIPRSFSVWEVDTDEPSFWRSPDLDAFIKNVPADRTEECPLHIQITDEEWMEAVEGYRHLFHALQSYSHVTLGV